MYKSLEARRSFNFAETPSTTSSGVRSSEFALALLSIELYRMGMGIAASSLGLSILWSFVVVLI
jgi:hypothetical protein